MGCFPESAGSFQFFASRRGSIAADSRRLLLNAVNEVDPDHHGLQAAELVKIAKGGVGGYGNDAIEPLRDAVEEICESSIKHITS